MGAPPTILPECACSANCMVGSAAASYHQPQRGHRFRPSGNFPTARCGPDCQRRPPWQLGMHVEQPQQNFECPHRHTPISLSFDNRIRVIVHLALFYIARRRHKSDLHCRGGRCVPEVNLYSARKRLSLSRQTTLLVNFAIRVCPQL